MPNKQKNKKTKKYIKCFSDKESQKVKFEYNPHTENITEVVKEMVETLELDQTREPEILRSIQTKVDSLAHSLPTTIKKSVSMPPKPSNRNQNDPNNNNQPSKPKTKTKLSTNITMNEAKKSISSQPPPSLNINLITNTQNQNQTVTSPVPMNMFHFNNNQTQPPQQRASTQPPQQIAIDPNNTTQQRNSPIAYTEPQSASTNPPNQPPPFYSEPPTAINQNQNQNQNQNHFPKVFNSNGTTATHPIQHTQNNNNNPNAMPITSMLNNVSNHNQRQSRPNINTNQPPKYNKSAPVTPGQSPENESKIGVGMTAMHRGGYVSDTGSDYIPRHNNQQTFDNINSMNQAQPSQPPPQQPPTLADNVSEHSNATNTTNAGANTKPVNDSLLDQIMALPRDTIKARIIQFGGNYNEDDGTGILVTKLFQLLSANDSSTSRNTKPPSQHTSNKVHKDNLSL